MKLKSLELFGFKSFVDKTVLSFEDGITAIVGPNGAGKSNCVDALRWAMGEQSAKHLRGAEMQDVIFNGTGSRSPIGMAQVVLRFDVSDGRAPIGFGDYSEIQVERRLYRSGESEYAINQVPCRLRDVIDLFLGTGVGTKAYSIIEQGRIDRILSAKPEERRYIIEEAAGISKFKVRKETALRKMETTEANLARLKDVVAEIKRQLNSLNRQARRAETYKKLYEELKQRELRLAGLRYQTLSVDCERLEQNRTDLTQKETELAGAISGNEADVEREKLTLAEREAHLNELQEKYYRTQNAVRLAEAGLEFQTSRLKDLSKQIETNVREVETAQTKLQLSEEEMETLNQTKLSSDLLNASIQERMQEVERTFQEALRACGEWQEKTEKANKEILECVGKVAEAGSHLEYLEKREVELEGRLSKGQAEVDALDRVLKELTKKIARAHETLGSVKQMSFQLSDETTQLKGNLDRTRAELGQNVDRLENLKAELAGKTSRLHSLIEIHKNMEGFPEGVRTVLQAADKDLKGVMGAVSDLIDVDASYEPAVSAVLGEKLQYVVVRSQKQGLEAIDYLRTQALGRSTFIPLDVEASAETTSVAKGDGVIGPLLEKVRFTDDYKRVAQFLFSDCLLVEDLNKALNLWGRNGDKKTFVTLQGEVLDSQGILSGGIGNEKESMLRVRKRIEQLEKEVAEAKTVVSGVQAKVLELKTDVQRFEEGLEKSSRDFHGEEIRVVTQERDILRFKEEEGRLNQDRDRLSLEIARTVEEQQALVQEREKILSDLENRAGRQQALEKDLGGYQIQLSQAVGKKERLSQELIEAKAKRTQAAEQAVRAEKELEDWIQEKMELQTRIDEKQQAIQLAQLEKLQSDKTQKNEREQLEAGLKELEILQHQQRMGREEYESLSRKTQGAERGLREIRGRHEEIVKALHAGDLDLAEVHRQLEFLSGQMLERYKIDLGRVALDVLENPDGSFSTETEEKEIAELKGSLEKLGSVHVGALEEFDELKRRYDFLSNQEADLEKSLEDLKKAIQKINRVSRERFLQTFEQVNEKFQEVFPKLFKGGKARLMLVDEQNLLETGVEIFAQPPGKKLQAISLLSGGERALTAVALIFSIFLIKPSPFCLLDEVDAPLDDANIDRFNDMVREMTSQSQFIVITHNKRTMERADCLYGVTMEEAGVSKIVSVRLNASTQEPLAEVA